jgi:hypothetical protein
MTVLPFATYFVYAYVLVPLFYRGIERLYTNHRYELCPVIKCIRPLVKCVKEPHCKRWLDDIQECGDAESQRRRQSAETFWFVQHPENPAYCQYQSFDSLETETALEFLECIGSSGCLAPSEYTDECVRIMPPILSFSTMTQSSLSLQGRWKKLYTTGWDIWPCQWTDFHPPNSTKVEPEPWMTEWPNANDVWRMDLYWKNEMDGPVTFHMNNEMYPEESWKFPNDDDDDELLPTTTATLKTRAVMWGTEAHENWYLLDYNQDLETLMIYFCAYTEAVDQFDSITMVLQKDGAEPITDEQAQEIELKALQLLGDEHGRLQRIEECR